MAIPQKTFSLDEVNKILPEVESRLLKLAEKKESYSRRHDELFMSELLHQAESEAGRTVVDIQEIEKDVQAFETFILEFEKDLQIIRDLGCVLRNIEKGWIDFPGNLEGQKVYFCWQRGESQVRFYRSLDQKASEERKPIL